MTSWQPPDHGIDGRTALPADGLLDGTADEFDSYDADAAVPARSTRPSRTQRSQAPTQTERHPYQSDVDYLQEVGARLDINGSTGELTSQRVLDAGRFGIEFFRMFGPAYAAVTGDRQSASDYVRRYDAQREIRYEALRQDAQRHHEIQGVLTERIIDFQNAASPVFEAWQGEAAGQAKSRFDGFLQRAEQVRAQFADLGEVLTAAVDAADRVLFEKASGVADLYSSRVGSLTPDDLMFVIDFGRRCTGVNPGPNIHDDEIRRVAGFCGMQVNPVLCRLNPDMFGQVGSDVHGWLESVFVPFYDARVAAFTQLCSAADTVVDASWKALSAMLREVSADPFAGLFPEQPVHTVTSPTVTGPSVADSSAAAQADPASESADTSDTGSDQLVAPAAADDRPVPDTPASHPGGISSSLDGGTSVGGDDPTSGPETDATDDSSMHPAAAAGGLPVAPVAPMSPVAGAGPGTSNTFFGSPYFGGAGSRGGGDLERHRSVPLAGAPFDDAASAAEHGGQVIGGSDDQTLYNEDATAEAEQPPKKKSLLEELEDGELW